MIVSIAVRFGRPVASTVIVFVVELTVAFALTIVAVPVAAPPAAVIVAVHAVAEPPTPAKVTPVGIPLKVYSNWTPCVEAPPLNCAALLYMSIYDSVVLIEKPPRRPPAVPIGVPTPRTAPTDAPNVIPGLLMPFNTLVITVATF